METWDILKELGLFFAVFLVVPLYIQWDLFIIVQFAIPAQYHQFPSKIILVLKSLHLNLLNIMILLTLKVVLGDHPTRLETI